MVATTQTASQPKTTSPKIKRGAGRPRSFILSPEQYERCMTIAYDQGTMQMIADVIDVSYDSLKRHYEKKIRAKRSEGRADLLHVQREQATRNPIMAIFLGKNHLGQADKMDKPDVHVTIEHKSFDVKGLGDTSICKPDVTTLMSLPKSGTNADNVHNIDSSDQAKNPTEAPETRESSFVAEGPLPTKDAENVHSLRVGQTEQVGPLSQPEGG